ncbi:MAG: CPBP family intramembrane glutamic endopeptidase [Sphingomonadales bacterium]
MTAKSISKHHLIPVLIILAITAIAYPIFRGTMPIEFTPSGALANWWGFWGGIILGHWVMFGLIAWHLKKTGEGWASIGLDPGFFKRHRFWLGGILVILIIAAFVVPDLYYKEGLPKKSFSHPFGPVSTGQRLFWILASLTAGITEEVIFRGFALTRFTRLFKSRWLAIPIPFVTFMWLHGTSALTDPTLAIPYAAATAFFVLAFTLLKHRRLEILIIIHAIVDLSFVLAP